MLTSPQKRITGFAVLGLSAISLLTSAFTGSDAGKLDYHLAVKPTVMTVAYKAYGNSSAADGKYWVARMVMENDGESTVEDISISYRIPEYVDWTTPQVIDELLPGQTRIGSFYPKLPTKVTRLRSRTPSSIEFKMSWHDGEELHEKIETRDFEFRGVNEIEYTSLAADEMLSWSDMFDNAEICAAFVTDEDPVVRQYMGEISETMGGIPICSNAEELVKVMQSIYAYQVGTGMKYTGNKGVPERLGDATSTVQNVRLPRDVIYQNSGLCIELAMLWAALGQGSSAKAYLVLVPGHCYPVLEAADGSIIPIEATGIGGANVGGTMSFEQAVEAGSKQFNSLLAGEIPGTIIDVVLHQGRGIRAPEFEEVDLADLARLLDERTAKALSDASKVPDQPRVPDQPIEPQGPNPPQPPTPPNVTGEWQYYQVQGLNARVPYPKSYVPQLQTVRQMQQSMPALKYMVSTQNGDDAIEIYAAAGMSGKALMQSTQQLVQRFGSKITYGQSQNVMIGGQQGSLYTYTLRLKEQQLVGGLYVYETNAGLFAFAVGGKSSNWRVLGDKIASTVRFGR